MGFKADKHYLVNHLCFILISLNSQMNMTILISMVNTAG